MTVEYTPDSAFLQYKSINSNLRIGYTAFLDAWAWELIEFSGYTVARSEDLFDTSLEAIQDFHKTPYAVEVAS